MFSISLDTLMTLWSFMIIMNIYQMLDCRCYHLQTDIRNANYQRDWTMRITIFSSCPMFLNVTFIDFYSLSCQSRKKHTLGRCMPKIQSKLLFFYNKIITWNKLLHQNKIVSWQDDIVLQLVVYGFCILEINWTKSDKWCDKPMHSAIMPMSNGFT